MKVRRIFNFDDPCKRRSAVERVNGTKTNLVERIRSILAQKGLTLHQVSSQTIRMYGRSSPFFLPHNLFYDLSLGSFTPSLHQVFALSRISDFRFHDWLRVFGFAPENITRLQVSLPSRRTMLIDSSLDDPESWIPWFHDKTERGGSTAITPLGQILGHGESWRLHSLLPTDKDQFVYAKVGREDAFAFPDLVPGSIVRSNTRLPTNAFTVGGRPDRLFLIEHAAGLCCCRLQAIQKDRIVPLSLHLPYAQPELSLHDEVRIVGVIDLEIRSLLNRERPEVPKALAKHWRPLKLIPDTKLSLLLRNARRRMGLSFRVASLLSRRIAADLRDPQYFLAPGSLSDYETVDTPPRHLHKIISMCAIYGVHFASFLRSINLPVEQTGWDPIPDHLVPRDVPISGGAHDISANQHDGARFLELLKSWGPVPFFLRGSLSGLSGLKRLSLHDFFWIAETDKPLHPLLEGGLVLITNRSIKKPVYSLSLPLCWQPLYILLMRDGTYICASCSLEDEILVIHSSASGYRRVRQLRNHRDVEVVGQVVTVARTPPRLTFTM